MDISSAIDLFMREKKMGGFSPKTISFYNNALKKIDSKTDTSELQVVADDFFTSITKRDYAPSTLHTYFRAMKTFCRWCEAAKYCDPVVLPKIRRPGLTVRPMSQAQVRSILAYYSGDDFYSVRNRAIIHMLWDTGLRVSELSALSEDTIDWDDRWVLVERGKGVKDRHVPYGRKTRQHLWTWWKRRAEVASPRQRYLFISSANEPLKAQGVQMIFRRLKNHFNFPGVRLSAHTLRHTFAVHYIESGGDPFTLQRILGHEDQQMTSRYVNVSRTHLLDAHRQYAPGDRPAPGD